ncbi:MAG: NAD(P)H-dependent oxidoreductase subunit E [Clostridia bacterium]|nr:NAD(P)H-dependent oxidoreductase subunit E [Clostridia bacterium]MBR2973515.1 NAD(P)H-dependent oxidoreductase subunit E [Clostridia bacterium]MBR3577098.1 NAD(P)H-dependent oxidoreductase subunit E [Clostridia bacterium]
MATKKIPAFKGTKEQEAQLMKVIAEHKGTDGALIPVLHEAQDIYGYLPIEVQKMVSEGLGVSLAEIYGVATFYARFTLEPKGEHHIGVCLGTACYVKGSGKILEKISKALNLEVGGCTEDGKFSLEATRCIGACGLAPVLTVGEEVYGRLTENDVDDILAKYM